MSCCVVDRVNNQPVKLNNKGPFKRAILLIPITAFKCKECGETDRDIAEKYCGNDKCLYRK